MIGKLTMTDAFGRTISISRETHQAAVTSAELERAARSAYKAMIELECEPDAHIGEKQQEAGR